MMAKESLLLRLRKSIDRKSLMVLATIAILGLILRTINLRDQIFFAYDQGRDAARIFQMAHGSNLKLMGPETDIAGVFNGPLFYYLLLPIYFIFRFNPNFVSLFIVLVNIGEIFIVYEICRILLNSKRIGYLSAFFWAVSFEQSAFARYISNASFMSVASLLFFFGLILYIFKRRDYGLILSMIGYGASIHFNFYLIYLGIFYPVFYLIYKPNVKIKPLFQGLFILALIMAPYFLAEIKWKFMMSGSMLRYFTHQLSAGSAPDMVGRLLSAAERYSGRIGHFIQFSFFPLGNRESLLLLLASAATVFFAYRNNKNAIIFLLVWLFSTLPLFFFNSGVLLAPVINSTVFVPLTVVFAAAISILFSNNKTALMGVALALIVFMANISLFIKDGFRNNMIWAYDPMLYGSEKQVVDYVYNSAGGKDFSVCALTNPLFVNSLWSFLFNSYGKPKYGYLPYWSGQKQYGDTSLLPYDSGHARQRYLIIEPLIGIPENAKLTTVYMEDSVSVLKEEKKFGTITVQKRLLEKDKRLLHNTQKLDKKTLDEIKGAINVDPRYSCFNEY